MKLKIKKLAPTVIVLVCLLAAAAAVWGICKAVRQLNHYGEHTTISAEPSPQQPPQTFEQMLGTTLIEGLPLNSFQAEDFSQQDGFVHYSGVQPWATGVDVSAHQQQIDWQAVADDGVQFALIRLGNRGYTEGKIALDEYFFRNIEGAQSAGLDVGVYFFSQAIDVTEAVEEAEFVLEQIEDYELQYPVFFDWEPIEAQARTDGMDKLTLTDCAYAFCRRIEDAGYEAGVYFNQVFGYQELDLPKLREFTFWLAEYNPAPGFTYAFELWQYSCEGTVDGIDTPVDLNISFQLPQ